MRVITQHLSRWLAVLAAAAAMLVGGATAAADFTDPTIYDVKIPESPVDVIPFPLPNAGAAQAEGLAQMFPNITGAGQTVAVLDSGIDYTHPDLAGRYLGGYDFVNKDSNPRDDNGHGTHVSGIIAAGGSNYPGLAPGAGIVALKILNSSGSGSYTNIALALDWVLANRETYNITAVNMSLGAGNYATPVSFAMIDSRISQLKAEGVFVAVSAGNSFYSYGSAEGVAYPAASPDAIAVGNAWADNFGSVSWGSGARDYSTGADRVVSHSQRGDLLDILAPGALITSTRNGGGYTTMGGTSMSAPYAAAASVLVRQAFEQAYGRTPTVDEILNILQTTGRPVYDGDDEDDNVINTGHTWSMIDIQAALTSLSSPVPEPTTLAFLGTGGMVMIGGVIRNRRQRRRKAA